MKAIIKLFCIFSILICCTACNNDDTNLDEKSNVIEYTVQCDTPDAQMHVDATGGPENGLYCKGKITYKCVTRSYIADVIVTCKDPKALIEVTLYVNNKKVAHEYGNSYVYVSKRLKGKPGPYLINE